MELNSQVLFTNLEKIYRRESQNILFNKQLNYLMPRPVVHSFPSILNAVVIIYLFKQKIMSEIRFRQGCIVLNLLFTEKGKYLLKKGGG